MTEPIWRQKRIRPTQHRIVWWLVDVQLAAGGMGKTMRHGWQKICCRQMGMDRVTLYRNLTRLVELGVVERFGKGEVRLSRAAFGSAADPRGLKMT